MSQLTIQAPEGRAFDRILIVMLENQYRSYCLENPYLRALAAEGVMIANSFGCMHPSQTNYIASVAGELCNVTSDEKPTPALDQRTIVDLVEEAGLSWRAYMQGYRRGSVPWTPDFVPQDDYPYVIKHNPFSSFSRIIGDETRWAKVGDEADFFADVLNGELPHFSWFTPDMWNDGHYLAGTQKEPPERAPILVDQLADWLRGFFAQLRFPGPDSLLPARTLAVVTFDEADFEKGYSSAMASTYDGPNQIYTVLLGDGLGIGVEAEEGYNHYSLLRTIERNFGLGDLGKNDAEANWYRFLWGRHFGWAEPASTELKSAGRIAAATHRGRLHAVTQSDDGAAVVYRLGDLGWREVLSFSNSGEGALAMASDGEALWICTGDPGGVLSVRDASSEHAGSSLGGKAREAAIEVLPDGRLMVAWEDGDGKLWSSVGDGKTWSDPIATGCETSGGLALTRQGAVVHLLFPRGEELRWQTWNTADFNIVTVPKNPYGGAWDNSSKDAWSPCSFPVAHWSSAPDAATPGEPEPAGDPHLGCAPIGAATLDGVVRLVSGIPAGGGLSATSMSIPGLLTPSKPVSYNEDPLDPNYSNGFGTAAQAGWSPQHRMGSVDGAGSVAIAAISGRMAVLVSDEDGRIRIVWGDDCLGTTYC